MPIGGVGETGALNSMLYEGGDTAILVDCGVGFAGDRFPGANVIIPDFRDLEPMRSRLKALVLTHGHEDHVGAVAHFRKYFPDLPIYATDFTMGIVRQKFTEAGLAADRLVAVTPGRKFSIGELDIEPIFINHSILDAVALLIAHGARRALHLTDFKIDHSAPEGKVTDLARFKKIGEEGLGLLLMDSTNVFSPGWTDSEMVVRAGLMERFTSVKGRIVACLFSSNIMRIQSLIECARVTGRKIAFTGRSTKEYTRIAREIAKLDLGGVELYDVEEVTKFPDSEILVLATGSQAEPRSVLQRMSHGMFKPFKLREGDTLLMSSKMIPGNEGRILEMMNRVSTLGVDIVAEGMDPAIHASGHAKQDELREVLRLTKPQFFIPIHGEYRHLRKHAEIAVAAGVPESRSVIIMNGDTVALCDGTLERLEPMKLNRLFLHENDGEISADAVRRRRKMAANGLVGVGVIYDKLRGVVMSEVTLDVSGMLGEDPEGAEVEALAEHVSGFLAEEPRMDRDKIAQKIKVEVRHYYKNRHQLKPEVMVLVSEI